MTDAQIPKKRISSIDILRGLVIVIMALDHVRDMWGMTTFAPEDFKQGGASWFFTRWITHFCAPVFVFLAGSSAFLFGNKIKSKRMLSKFLWTRGLWLIFLEIVWINFSWTLSSPSETGFIFLQVIWVIGICMVLMAALIYLNIRILTALGLLLLIGQNALDGMDGSSWGSLQWLFTFLHGGFSFIPLGEVVNWGILVVYAIIPWLACMILGYSFGRVYILTQKKRFKYLKWTGISLILFFVLLRWTNLYGDPSEWVRGENFAHSLMSFLNTTKYPASLLYLSMTLGPGILLLWLFEKYEGILSKFFLAFGAVPFFFYMLHFIVINLSAQIYFQLKFGQELVFLRMGPDTWPSGYEASLSLVYLVWALLIFSFYFLCKRYGQYKRSHRNWWLKYL